MNYNFDEQIDRRNTDSIKWKVGEGELPMWVADMDFRTAPEIMEAISDRLRHGVFGYGDVIDEWYEAYIRWWRERHHFEMDKAWLMFCTGVIPAISSVIRKLTTPNENVLIQTPVYNIFFNCIKNNGARVLENELIYDDGQYTVDFEDLEAKLSDPQTTLMFLCNPQNPSGKIWDRDTLYRIGELAHKHNVTVVADEIHCDITEPQKEYTPFASVSDICRDISITCIAPTKTFNLAGLQTSAICVPNPVLRHKVKRAINTDEVAEPNSFAVAAATSAFNEGGGWLDELCDYISANKRTAIDYIKEEIPQLSVARGDATYLLWIDISKLNAGSREVADHIRKETGLFITAGIHYGEAGDHFLRMNLACPRETCMDGLDRLKKGVASFSALR